MRRFVLWLILCTGSWVLAQEPLVYTFKAWKEQQLTDAQNQVARSTTHLNQLKAAIKPAHGKKATDTPETVAAAERDLKRAEDGVQAASSLQFDDYVNIYVPTLQDQPELVGKLVDKLNKEELSELVKALVLKDSKSNDTKRNHDPLLDGLADSRHSKGTTPTLSP